MEAYTSDKEPMNSFDLYRAHALLEEEIQNILQDKNLSRKRKRQCLRALEESCSNSHLRSHVRYYLDLLEPKIHALFLNIASVFAVAAFFAYTILRIVNHF